MKQVIFALLFAFAACIISVPANAADGDGKKAVASIDFSINTDGLTSEQAKAVKDQLNALKSAADQMKKDPKAENPLVQLAEAAGLPKWISTMPEGGAAAGKAVANFAKEVGIGASEFLKTDVGKYTLIAAIWKLGGGKCGGKRCQYYTFASSGRGVIHGMVETHPTVCFWASAQGRSCV